MDAALDDLWDSFDKSATDDIIPAVESLDINHYRCTNRACNAANISDYITDGNMTICTLCNTIQERDLDANAEWKMHTGDNSRGADVSRCSAPTDDMFPNMSMGSVIGHNGDSRKNSLGITKMRQRQVWNSCSYKETALYYVNEQITIICANNNIPSSIAHHAIKLYNDINSRKITRGDNRAGIIAACLYYSCKMNGAHRTTLEISQMFNIESSIVTKGTKDFNDILTIEVQAIKAVDLIDRFCSKMNIMPRYIALCKEIVKNADDNSIVCENTIASIAAGAIYLVSIICDLKLSKKDVEEHCIISQVTINKCYKNMVANISYLITDDMKRKYADIITQYDTVFNTTVKRGRKKKIA
jgi:transcription initiation factor TFIIB